MHASITVQFKFFHSGQETEYHVTRMWTKEDGDVDEHLNLGKRLPGQEDFGPLDTVEKSQWQSFIEDLIPRGIVNLFFFDGEKIVDMAREGTEDATIRESFKSLLGIEIVEQLRTDLQVNLTRNLTGGGKALRQDFEKYKAEKDESMSSTEKLRERLAEKQTDMDALNKEMEGTEARISRIGGAFASGRDEAKARLASAKAEHGHARERLSELCSGVLPFSIIPKHLADLHEQTRADDSMQQHIAESRSLGIKFKRIMDEVRKPEFAESCGLDERTAKGVAEKISCILDRHKAESKPPVDPVLGFSYRQMGRIDDIIDEANGPALGKLGDYTRQLVAAEERISELESSIASAPDDDEVGPLVTRLGDLKAQTGTLKAEMDHIEEKLSTNHSLRQHLDSKLRDIVSQIYKSERSRRHVELTQAVQGVLDEFVERLRAKKILLLEQHLLEALQLLLHKKNLIEKVRVDPETFGVTLFRRNDDLYSKDLLSEGEKQMFATAVLWALARTSGRPLPFMIDTPLARLDESHRANIVERFLPVASHQVLVFSTDAEINLEHYRRLAPHLSRSYAMEYLDEAGASRAHDGYFWDKRGNKVVAVQ